MIQLKPGISASQFNKGRKGRARTRTRRDTGAQRAGLHFKRVFSDAKCALAQVFICKFFRAGHSLLIGLNFALRTFAH